MSSSESLGTWIRRHGSPRDSRSPRPPRLWLRPRGRDRWRFCRQAEVVEDPADAVRVVDGGEQSATLPAARAGEHVDEVDAAQQLGPGVELARAAVLRRGVGGGQLAAAAQRVVVERVVWRFGRAVGRTRRLRSAAFAVGAVVAIGGTFIAIVIGERRRWHELRRCRSSHAASWSTSPLRCRLRHRLRTRRTGGGKRAR